VDENAAGAVVGNLSTTDVDAGDTHSYSVDDARFEVVGGQLKLKDGVSLDHEAESSVDVEVTTTDASGATFSETFSIAVGDVNEGPSDIALSNASVDENAAGAVVGTLSTTDVDAGDTHSYAVDDARFEVVGGQLKLKDGQSLNHEAEASVAVEVTTTDASGATYSETFSIAVGDVNEGPSDIALSNASVDENAAGAVVGTLSTTDVDAGDTHSYSVDDARFEVVGGQLKLKDGQSLNHEAEASVAVEVTTTDASGATYSETFNIAVGDVNEGPSDIALSNASVDENAAGAVVGNLSTSDVDAGDTHSYSVDDARFEVVGGQLKLKDGQSLNHEAEASVAVEVTTTDASGATYSETFSIAVGDVNEGPSDIALSNASVDENAAGAVVGTLSTTDVDAGDTHSYSVDDARFEVVGGQLKLKDGQSLNHEAEASVAVEVTTTDASGATFSETFSIAVGDVNEGPSDIALSNTSVDENAAGAVVGNLSTTDVDAGDTHSYSVDDARFEVVGGQLKLKDGQSLNHEAESSVAVEVTTTDASGATFSETFNIAVGDVNEGPSAGAVDLGATNEDTSVVITSAQLLANSSDVDDGDAVSVSSLSVDAQYGSIADNGDGTWTFTPANDVSADNVPFSFTVTDGEASDSATATLDIAAVADTPTISLASTTTTIIDSSFEGGSADFVSTADGWSTDSDAIEVWSESEDGPTASDGDKFIELNDDAIDTYDDAADIHQTVDTVDGATYTLTFDVSPRAGYDASVNTIEVLWDGAVVDTISLDGSSNSDNVWQSFEYTMTGDGDPSKLQFREAGVDQDNGRGMYLDNIKLTETTDGSVVSGTEDGTIGLPDISAGLGDTDGSETLSLTVGNIPDGATLSDGTNTFTASGGTTSVDVSGWDMSALEVTPTVNYNGTFNLSVTATATEGLNASTSSDTVQIEVNVASVNDGPSDLSLSNNSVDENVAGAVIGDVTTTDADVGDSHAYAVDDARFEVVGGQLKLKDGVSLDYETETSVAVEVTTTDASGASYAETFSINVGDIADAPVELWSEDFSGLSNGVTSDPGSTAWSATDAGSDMTGNHGVESGAYEFGQVSDESNDNTSKVVWSSETIDISGQSEIDLSFRLSENGDLEESGSWHDTFKAFAVIDGVRTEIMSQDGDSGIQDAYNFQDIGTGSSLVIEFEAKTTSGSETFSVDDISVVANGSQTPLYEITDPGDAMPSLSGATYTTDDDYDGSSGDDTIVYNGSNSDNKIEGKDGDDILVDDNTKGELKGGDGDDTLYGRGGDDTLKGEDGNDTLYGGSGDDKLEGKDGDDILVGGTGDDELKGGKGEDVLFGGAGDDELKGEDGSDLFIFESGNGDTDTIDGGSGSSWTDTIQLQGNGGGAVSMDWTLELDGGSVEGSDMGSYDLSEDASGTITFADGSEISFDNIERIEW
jgi:VCBS repeat-containing protein